MRERGIWVGLLTADGRAVSLGDTASVERERPACRFLKANGHLGGPSETAGEPGTPNSCHGSLQRWRDTVVGGEARSDVSDSQGPIQQVCHAGFAARLLPIQRDDESVGAVYASGFWTVGDDGSIADEKKAFDDRMNGFEQPVEQNAPRLKPGEVAALESSLSVVRRLAESRLSSAQPDSEPYFHSSEVVRFEGMVAASKSMQRLFDEIRTIAASEASVLITGENGTGKEMVARAIHRRSGRAGEPLVPLNCAALSPQLVASELFGHVKGAFSGAEQSRAGLLATADGGTLLLDEIGEMSEQIQRQLLRFVQEGEYSPIGSNERRRADVRVVCATNRDLAEQVEAGEFRRDLFFRIGVARFEVPPLRDRPDDIAPLAAHFVSEMATRHGRRNLQISDACLERLRAYTWPGNVRELRNNIERAVIRVEDGAVIGEEDVDVGDGQADGEFRRAAIRHEETTLPEAIEALERQMIRGALEATGWNKTQAAERLDVSRRTMIRKVDEYGLSPGDEGKGD
jgi:DNA-binding NtrC family response regulator